MADSIIAVDKVKEFWRSQVNDEQQWAANAKLLRALALFGGAVFLMKNFGDLMAI